MKLFHKILKYKIPHSYLFLRKNMSGSPVIKTSYGNLRGGYSTSRKGKKFLYFSGIPYAEPPVGTLRFKPPVPPQSWSGIRDALKEGSPAIQVDMFSKKIIGDEDCLYVNVYTPDVDSSSKPVIVWIHGGAFGIGSGGAVLYGANYLMDHDVVLVTFNYRLGALGFMNLDLEDAAGNMGMKDQVLLLKWVQEEIKNFGGDPKNVTISGSSAGGASVHYHMISPLSKGLFHRAIAQSGTIPCEWAFMKHHFVRSMDLGKYLGCDSSNPQKLLEELMTVPARKFVESQNFVVPNEKIVKGNCWAFVPSIETVGKNRFLSSDPYKIVTEDNPADVPFLTGFNSFEGALIPSTILNHSFLMETINNNFKVLFEDLAFPPTLTQEEVLKLASKARKEYFHDGTIAYPQHFDEIVKFYGDILITFPTILTLHFLRKNSRQNPVYLYKFCVDTPQGWYKQNLIKKKVLKPDQAGASHCDELGYLFNSCLVNQSIEPGSLIDKTITRMTKMWTNFARSGNPSDEVHWEPAFPCKNNCPTGLEIGEDLKLQPLQEFNLLSTFQELAYPCQS